jgi:hypothetical protein
MQGRVPTERWNGVEPMVRNFSPGGNNAMPVTVALDLALILRLNGIDCRSVDRECKANAV